MSVKDTLGNDIGAVDSENGRSEGYMTINELPSEVIVEIFGNLELVQLNSLRLVCRYWNHIISDKSIWEKSFRNKFGNEEIFPSFAFTDNWIVEYLSRVNNLKKWKKSVTKHINYQILSEIFLANNDYVLTNFQSDKLLTYCKITNSITICSLHNGKNQTFIPGNQFAVVVYSINWNYLVFSSGHGGLYMKNLITSTSVGGRSSITTIIEDEDAEIVDSIVALDLNMDFDKHKQKLDIIAGFHSGKVSLFNLSGSLIKSLLLDSHINHLKSDFKTTIVATTQTAIYIINIQNFDLKKIDVPLFETDFPSEIDHDFEYGNIIFRYYHKMQVINYRHDYTRELNFQQPILLGKLQQLTPPNQGKYFKGNNVIGKDGLFYANVLQDNEVIIWNVRESSKDIKIRCRFYSDFKYKHMSSIIGDDTGVNAIELNSSVIVLGGYNGYCNIHDIFTGKFIRESSVKFPKKYSYMFQNKIPVKHIRLNESFHKTNGVIMCGDLVQYFQFGEINDGVYGNDSNGNNSEKRKKLNMTENNKKNTLKVIKDQLEDYDLEEYQQTKLGEMYDKYNGADLTSEDELTMALALSESSHTKSPEDQELEKILEMSRQEQEQIQTTQEQETKVPETAEGDEEEQLRRIIELSLIDQ